MEQAVIEAVAEAERDALENAILQHRQQHGDAPINITTANNHTVTYHHLPHITTTTPSARTLRYHQLQLNKCLGEGKEKEFRMKLLTGNTNDETSKATELGAPTVSIETQIAAMQASKWTHGDIQQMRNMGLPVHPVKSVVKFNKQMALAVESFTDSGWNATTQVYETVRHGGWKDLKQCVIKKAIKALESNSLSDIPAFPLRNCVIPGMCTTMPLPHNTYWFQAKLQVDRGGGLLKLVFHFINHRKPNSIGHILYLTEAHETYENMLKYCNSPFFFQ